MSFAQNVVLIPKPVYEFVGLLLTWILGGAGVQVVGWYHSHPVFVTQPSITDIRNQFNHQVAMCQQTRQ